MTFRECSSIDEMIDGIWADYSHLDPPTRTFMALEFDDSPESQNAANLNPYWEDGPNPSLISLGVPVEEVSVHLLPADQVWGNG